MIIYNGKNSLKDFDLYVASKDIPAPVRKEITETVPLMSGEWDFSFHDDGVDEYETLPIKYTFDVIADSKQELNSLKTALIAWLHSRGDQKLYDSDISLNEYYVVYRAQAAWSEEGLQGLLSVEFKCYPLRKADETIKTLELSEEAQSLELVNNSARPIMPVFELSGTGEVAGAASVIVGDISFALTTGTYKGFISLPKGKTTIQAAGVGTLKIKTWREVL